VTGVQGGNPIAVSEALEKVVIPTNMLQLYPIIQRAATESKEILNMVTALAEAEESFADVARICANRTGRPGLLEFPAFEDLKKLHFSVSSCYLFLRKHLEDWVMNYR